MTTVWVVLASGLLAIAVVLTPWFRKHPIATLSVYLGLGLSIPYWLGVEFGGQFLPVIFLLSVWALLMTTHASLVVNFVDRLFLLLVAVCTLATSLGLSSSGNLVTILGSWLAPYLIGRFLATRVPLNVLCLVFSVIGGLLAAQALIEFFLSWHPFLTVPSMSGQANVWSEIQFRGGFPRSEGALGHSISLGNVLAICVPFIILGPMKPRWKVVLVSVVAGGVMVTFSRNALVAFVAAIVLTMVFASNAQVKHSIRLAVLGTLGLAALAIGPIYMAAIAGASQELESSTLYRANFASVIPDVAWFGRAQIYVQIATDEWGWASSDYPGGVIHTLDNTVLLFALQFGWIPTAILAILLLAVLFLLVRSHDNPALVATASQVTTVLTVAMITQFAYIYWLVLGLAVGYQVARNHGLDFENKSFGQRLEGSEKIKLSHL